MATHNTSLSRGAARPLRRRASALLAALSVILMSGGLVLVTTPAATAGNNGTLKVHEQGTPSGTENNDPKVCTFNFEGFGFDPGQSGEIDVEVQGGDGPTGTPFSGGTATANSDGYFATGYLTAAPGHYKATFTDLEDNKYKSKVFKVQCEAEPPTPANPSATITKACGTASVSLANTGGTAVQLKITATGKPDQSVTVQPNGTEGPFSYTFAEDSNGGTATVSVLDGQAVVESESVVTDCEQTPPPTPANPRSVTPNAPSQTPPTCTTPGSVVAPAAQTGVSVARTELGNGAVRFDSTPSAGYVFSGPQTVSATVTTLPRLGAASCGDVEGVEESASPPASNPSTPSVPSKPTRPANNGTDAEVQGVADLRPVPSIQGVSNVRNSAAVPLAVDAGLAGAGPDSRTLLAQSLLGAGLMLLVAAGCSVGLVRRRDGVDVA